MPITFLQLPQRERYYLPVQSDAESQGKGQGDEDSGDDDGGASGYASDSMPPPVPPPCVPTPPSQQWLDRRDRFYEQEHPAWEIWGR